MARNSKRPTEAELNRAAVAKLEERITALTLTGPEWKPIEARRWQHKSGTLATSFWGACPWTSDADRANWTEVVIGWTATNGVTIGFGRKPWATRDEAADWCAAEHKRILEALEAQRRYFAQEEVR